MTTHYAADYHLPRATKVAAALQLIGLAALTALTWFWALIALAFAYDDGTHSTDIAAVLLAATIALPAPVAAIALVTALVRSRRRGAPPVVHFEIATCAVVGAVFVAGWLASLAVGRPMPLVGLFAGIGPAYLVYLILAAAVVVPIRRQAGR